MKLLHSTCIHGQDNNNNNGDDDDNWHMPNNDYDEPNIGELASTFPWWMGEESLSLFVVLLPGIGPWSPAKSPFSLLVSGGRDAQASQIRFLQSTQRFCSTKTDLETSTTTKKRKVGALRTTQRQGRACLFALQHIADYGLLVLFHDTTKGVKGHVP